ncbi:hypothetical protein FD18_GL000242 [Lactobacillus taiwanensis DSM 21401]|nr:hypothetical protein [Lactobacillus taiwanensis]KRM99152.1 hypothetical protein FD18_GL000242 [Lactobacillus taiwanensis DSM 21401]MCR1916334.1 hypothetical protein [Lactobacillus taiwanensis]
MNKLFLRLTSIDSFVLSMLIGVGSMYVFECGYYYFRNDIKKWLEKLEDNLGG